MEVASPEVSDNSRQKLRDLRAQLSFLPRADGSCALEQGTTVIWCGINGPGNVSSSKRLSERLVIDILYKDAYGAKDSVKVPSCFFILHVIINNMTLFGICFRKVALAMPSNLDFFSSS